MKQLLLCVGYCLLVFPLFAQTGSPTDPFTSLSQARSVTTAGNYSFEINGVAFRTYVDAAGYVQVAYDDRTDPTPKTRLSQFTDLPQGTRGILSVQVMATLGNLTELRISSSNLGQLDARTFTNTTLTARITGFQALMSGSADNAHMEDWTGTGSEWLRRDAGAVRAVQPLDEEIVHVHRNEFSEGVHWLPLRGDRNLVYKDAVPELEPWTLWVRGAASQTAPGSRENPFTSLDQSLTVTTPGVYYFSLGGPVFDTYVDDRGYVQVAIDFGGTNTALPQSDHLTDAARGILTPAALASLTDIGEVRMTSSVTGTLDAVTADPGIFAKIRANDALMTDIRDNAINQAWTGAGSEFLLGDSDREQTAAANFDRPLHEEIYHSFYGTGMHWIPYRSDQGLTYQADVGPADKFVLWVRSARYCAIDIGSLTPTDEGCPGGADGAIAAAASCSSCADGLEYSLDNSTFQSGGQFSNLAPGTYTVYVRAAGNTTGCLSSGTVTIAEGVDDTPPSADPLPDRDVLLCGGDFTVPTPVVLDACSGTVFGTTTDPITFDAAGSYTIDWIFTDDNGNVSTLRENVTVTGPVFPLPLLEDGEPGRISQGCWSPLDVNTDGAWQLLNDADRAHAGQHAYYLPPNTTTGQNDRLLSPIFTASPSASYYLTFYYRGAGNTFDANLGAVLLDATDNSVIKRLWQDERLGTTGYERAHLVFDVPANGTYRIALESVSAAGDNGVLLDDIALEVFTPPADGAAGLTEVTDGSCAALPRYGLNGSAWVRFLDFSDRVAIEINPNGNDLGDVRLELRHYAAPQIAPYNNQWHLSRHFNIIPGNGSGPYTANGGVMVRLYFTDQELADFNAAAGTNEGWDDLTISHYEDEAGSSEDCSITNSTGGLYTTEPQLAHADYGGTAHSITFITQRFSEFGASSERALPVTLRSFTGQVREDFHQLVWQVDQEITFSHYAIERSLDGRAFTELGQVPGKQQSRYTFTHPAPAAPAYYRLRMVDLDGAYAYSKVVRLAGLDRKPTLAVYPVPTGDELTVSMIVPHAGVVKLVLIDALGRPVVVTTREAGEGENRFTVGLHQVPPGTYVLRIQGAASSGAGALAVRLVQSVRVVRR